MFEISKKSKSMKELPEKTFSELNIKERDHLQEWIANTPNALGEELLIITKEFAGFEETRERLDLLAIDKEGALVIIENKLDDTGRDVVWQALKYAAHCSSSKQSDIVGIFKKYLSEQNRNDDAVESICDFLEVESIDEADINRRNSQRLILVAAKFRKEVTSTVLWLISNGIDAKCMKATPYQFNEKLLLDITQIIPPPEAADYMVRISSKQKEEEETETRERRGIQLRDKYWKQCIDHFHGKSFELYENINPPNTGVQWLSAGSGVSECSYILLFKSEEIRVDFHIKDENKQVFDFLRERKKEIEKRFGNKLDWKRLDERLSCRICFSNKSFDGFNEGNWLEMIEWMHEYMEKLEKAIKPLISDIKKVIKSKE